MPSTVRERPILFSGEMVKALLDGRKTQTRRIIKPPSWSDGIENIEIDCDNRPLFICKNTSCQSHMDCPYGSPGDRLWVREAFAEVLHTSPATDEPVTPTNGDRLIEHATRRCDGKGWHYDGLVLCYRATSDMEFCDGDGFMGDGANREDMPKWKPSIHMPRKYSRITLEITEVRVQRLQDISEEDASDEGVAAIENDDYDEDDPCGDGEYSYRAAFTKLWNKINGPGSWDANPWVWAVSFRPLASATK